MYFVDSNLWIYLFSKEDEQKYKIVDKLTDKPGLIISLQVVNEVSFILLRKFHFPEEEIKDTIRELYNAKIHTIGKHTLLKASYLRSRYQFSFWDSILVATGISCQCTSFFSEDMHDGLKIDGMEIINPFQRQIEE